MVKELKQEIMEKLGDFGNVEQFENKANQFLIRFSGGAIFQSYNSVIAIEIFGSPVYYIGKDWNYSQTTSKYRNIFLDSADSTQKVEEDLKSGVAVLVRDL